MKIEKKRWKWTTLVFTSVLILSACSNPGGTQDHGHQTNQDQNSTHPQGHGEHDDSKQMHHQDHSGGESAKVGTQWHTSIQQANQEGEIRIKVHDEKGKPIPEFKVHHEKKIHLIAVSEDLSYFSHLHPHLTENGEFVIKTKLPHGGKYSLYADFIPQGGSQVTAKHVLSVQGKGNKQPMKVDQSLTKIVNGKEISLQFSPKAKAKQETQLTFTLKDGNTKVPLTNLEPYLGAVGHVVIISEDRTQYLHVHPLAENAKGPEAKFATTFPKKGLYKIWGQFQHQGKIVTVPFVINVNS